MSPNGHLSTLNTGNITTKLLNVDGNPLEDMTVLGATTEWFDADPEYKTIDTIKLVMKDGVVYRNEM
ncbi:hypothetical protein BK411_13680 [Vibrio splendidus]|nr:hypothetical protein BK411_13680 [Vibrio splendidus]